MALLVATAPAFAKRNHSGNDRASLGSDITISEGDNAGDVACAFCSVRVHGDVMGDVAVLFGTVSVDSGHKIGGDIAILGGDLNLGEDAQAGGNVAILAGETHLANGATIHGSRSVLPGAIWLLIPFAPLILFIGIIWLIVHTIRRNRYPYAAYPPSRRGFPPSR
jgi:hypothetical protein